MSKKEKIINPGGINGTGKGIVNTNSKDFKGLQNAILAHSQTQTVAQRIEYNLLSLKFQMESYISEETPEIILSSGDFLRKYLKVIGIKNKEFADYIKIEESNLSAILKGRRKINIDIAYKLGEIFDLNPNLWLLIQSKNELLKIDSELRTEYKKYRLKDLLERVI